VTPNSEMKFYWYLFSTALRVSPWRETLR